MRGRESTFMKKIYLGLLLVVATAVTASVIYFNLSQKEVPRECFRLPKETYLLGSVTFSDGEARLLGAEPEDGKQVKRIAGTSIVVLDEHFLTVEIYTLGTRTLLKKETYKVTDLKYKYPVGFSIWVEQDATTAEVIFVPWI